jgi:hypothetical protein
MSDENREKPDGSEAEEQRAADQDLERNPDVEDPRLYSPLQEADSASPEEREAECGSEGEEPCPDEGQQE